MKKGLVLLSVILGALSAHVSFAGEVCDIQDYRKETITDPYNFPADYIITCSDPDFMEKMIDQGLVVIPYRGIYENTIEAVKKELTTDGYVRVEASGLWVKQ